jgi:transposase-like protein
LNAAWVAFLHSPVGQRVRTNNHVERANRELRFDEKVRYPFRSRRSLDRFLRLRLDLLGRQAAAAVPCRDRDQATPHRTPKSGENPGGD